MNPEEHERMRALEDHYWWFVARRRTALDFLARYAGDTRPQRVLDLGCGTGAMLRALATRCDQRPFGLDLASTAVAFCARDGAARITQGDAQTLPFADNAFDAVTALDMLEHLPRPEAAASEVARVLAPGGVLVATVPAYRWLWSEHDDALHHRRRYVARELRELLSEAGLVPLKVTYLLTLLFPAAAASRLWGHVRRPRAVPRAHIPRLPGFLNRLLVSLHAAEAALARYVSLPFGLSVLVVARSGKKDPHGDLP